MTPEIVAALILKFIGAAAGSTLALVFVPPRTRLGFARRATASLIGGVMFAPYVREWGKFADNWEGMIAAACAAAFMSWWAMGAVIRVLKAWQGPAATESD